MPPIAEFSGKHSMVMVAAAAGRLRPGRHSCSHRPKPGQSLGISFVPGLSPFWVSDNNAGVSTLYDGTGSPFPTPATPLVVDIPLPPDTGGRGGAPTGQVANLTILTATPVFNIESFGPADFIFATKDVPAIAELSWNHRMVMATVTSEQPAEEVVEEILKEALEKSATNQPSTPLVTSSTTRSSLYPRIRSSTYWLCSPRPGPLRSIRAGVRDSR
jgi:hypothetical protein